MRRWAGRSAAIALAFLLLAASSADAKTFIVNPEIADGPVSSNPVSYTHLTLPTILRV